MSELLKDGLIAVVWLVMGVAIGFELGGAWARSVWASTRTRSVNDDATEPVAGDASALAPGAEPSPSLDAERDHGRNDGAGQCNVGVGGHGESVSQKQEAGK